MAGRKIKKSREEKRAELDKAIAREREAVDKLEAENVSTDKVEYSEELAERLCEEIACTSKSLAWICTNNPGFPNPRTIYKWLVKYRDTFGPMYAHAREIQSHYMAEEIIHIADDNSRDEIIDSKGNEILNREFVERSKLRVNTRQWLAARRNRKDYGEKLDQEITGKDGLPFAIVHMPDEDPYPEDIEKNKHASAKK